MSGFLEIRELHKSFGPTTVVDDLNLDVEQGEFISILGPSGCGKTTTLRMVAGFIFADSGSISINGQRVDQLPSHRRGTAMVFQNYALFPHMTVFDNVAFGLKMHKVPALEIRERVQRVLEFIKLPKIQDSYPRQLSGGQQQRVALARALVLNPKILLLDEPLSNLDAKLRKSLRVELRDIHAQSGITTIFVTHDIEEAFSLADRVAIMHDGKLEQFGRPKDIFLRPASRFVADFVGHSNLIEGQLRTNGHPGAILDLGKLQVHVLHDGGADRSATFALPPHLVRVSSDPLALENCFPATIHHVSYLGSSVELILDVNGLRLSSEMEASHEATRLESGEPVYVGWRTSDAICIPDNS